MLSSARVQQRLARRTIALVLAGGRGSRLKQLTDRRAKPAVFFGGKFRIIDFALSNCLNSNIRRIAVLTQYKAHSLLRHLQMGWSFLRPAMNEFLDLLLAPPRRGGGGVSSSWQATTSTRWTTPTCWRRCAKRAPVASSPASRCQLDRPPISASWRSTTRCGSSIFSKNPAHRQRLPGGPTVPWRAWGSTPSPPISFTPNCRDR